MLAKNNQQLLLQIAIWILGWMLISFFLTNGIEHPDRFFSRAIPTALGMLLVIVFNYTILLPHFYFQKKIVWFIIGGVLLIAALLFLLHNDTMPWAEWMNPQRGPLSNNNGRMGDRKIRPSIIFGLWMARIMPFMIAFLGSTLVEIARYANKKEKEVIESERAQLDTELKLLKSQINPHFLFNTLNNIYTLTVIKSDKAPDNLLRLSEMLRYMLYETNSGKVSLKNELDYLKNYVQLMGLKDSRGLNVTLDLDESQPHLKVAPLLFIPFVENAYKHSKIEDLQNGFIHIKLKTEERQLTFTVENSVPENKYTKDKVGGIGLHNTQQRLHLIYPDKHQLQITESDSRFLVSLKLEDL